MRIAVALGGTDFGKSGIGVYVRAVVPALAALVDATGDELVLVGTRRDLEPVRAELASPLEEVVLDARWDAPAASAALYLSGGVDRAARSGGADVILLPAANRRASLLGAVPTVAVVHDLAQLHVRGKYDAMRMAYVRHVLRAALPRATELVAISGATKKDLVDFIGVPKDRVRIVSNGIDAKRFAPAASDGEEARSAARQFGLDSPYFVYVSRLEHPGKNHLRLLEAFASSPHRATTTLALAGGDWGAKDLIVRRAEELGISDAVKLLGFVPDDALRGLYAGATSAVMVGLAEGFGLPALEALAMGIPIVASTTGALPEVVGDLGLMCDPLEPASIAGALHRAATDRVHRARVRREGPRWAASRGWDATARGLYDACVSAAGLARSARAA